MTHSTIAGLAGALLLSTAVAAFAQGTTIVPSTETSPQIAQSSTSGDSGQSGETTTSDAPANGTSSGNGSSGSGQSGGETAASDGASSSETSSGETAEGSADGGAPVLEASDASNPEIDAHPSKDSQEEGNAVGSVNPVDAADDPGLALDTAEKPVYAYSGETPDWYTWRGYKKYGANCLQCHGPDGLGSSFAPNLTESLQNIDYYEFAGIIVGGQQNQWNPSGNSIMPAWGEDPNVMCSLSAIYVYLRGRADGVVGRGEPPRPEKSDKSTAAQDKEYSCLGF